MHFSVDQLATGDTRSTCTPVTPGLLPPDVGSEACGLTETGNNAATHAAGDIYATSPNAAPLGLGPEPGSMLPHYQLLDGDGPQSFPCPFGPGAPAPTGLVEPTFPAGPPPALQAIDDIDAYDKSGPSSGPFPFDLFPADGIGDYPLYYSVDPATAATSAGLFAPGDVIVAIGGVAAVYAPAPALGLAPGNDVDGLVVNDVFLDGVYAPGVGDRILYSLSAASPLIGAPDCVGVPIQAGSVLTEGTPFGFAGAPCVVIDPVNYGLYEAAVCGANPVTGALTGDELDAFDSFFPIASPPPLCAPTPAPDGSCFLADVSGVGKSSLVIKDKDPDKGDQVAWKWQKGTAVTAGDFFDPVAGGARYRLCIYDSSGAAQPIYQKAVVPNTIVPLCSGKPCWKASGNPVKGYKYKAKNLRLSGGLSTVSLSANATPGKSKVSFKLKGGRSNAPPTLSLVETPNVVVQLMIDDGVNPVSCFKTTFPAAGLKKQDAQQFSIKGP
jgi:hypothetical protein